MPKETIQDTAGAYDVRVGWAPDSVQVGVESAGGFSLVSMLYGDGDACRLVGLRVCERLGHRLDQSVQTDEDKNLALMQLGREVLNIVEASQSNPTVAPSYTGIWSTLDRAGLNRLIRVLRRARDAAYGRDE